MRSALLMLLVACQPVESPIMNPGDDCQTCHGVDGNPRRWTVAGTIFPRRDAEAEEGLEDAKIFVRDSDGRELTLTSNSAGNFYTAEPLKFPLTVSAQIGATRIAMEMPVEEGGCNSCHALVPKSDAPGRLFVE